jgi:hypothetical protein
MAVEIRLRMKYRVAGSSKKTSRKSTGNGGKGKGNTFPPRGIPRHYRGKTRHA